MSVRPDRTIGLAALCMAALFMSAFLFARLENPDPGEEAFSRWFLPLTSLFLVAIAIWNLRSRPK